jgi:hypothetical protein
MTVFLSDLIREEGAPRSKAYAWALDGTLKVEKVGSAVLVPEPEVPIFRLAAKLFRRHVPTPAIREVLDAARAVPPEEWKDRLGEHVLVKWSGGWRMYRSLRDVRTPLYHERRWAACLPLAEIL